MCDLREGEGGVLRRLLWDGLQTLLVRKEDVQRWFGAGVQVHLSADREARISLCMLLPGRGKLGTIFPPRR